MSPPQIVVAGKKFYPPVVVTHLEMGPVCLFACVSLPVPVFVCLPVFLYLPVPVFVCLPIARKLNLKIPLDLVKCPVCIQKLLYYRIQHEGGRHIDFCQMSLSPTQTMDNNCKRAFSLHVVESASDDYNF